MENKPKAGPHMRYLRAHLTAKLFRLASVNNEGFELMYQRWNNDE